MQYIQFYRQEKVNRWKEYTEGVKLSDELLEKEDTEDMIGDPILRAEFNTALKD